MLTKVGILVGVAISALSACQNTAGSGTEPAAAGLESSAQPDAPGERLDWWREARFGMFIHWGLYAVPAGTWKDKPIGGIGEWIMNSANIPVAEYEQLAKQFNPVKYDPAEWVRLAKEAGIKYLVITSKHHDGFCLFDSAETDWDVTHTPYGKDIMRQIADACRRLTTDQHGRQSKRDDAAVRCLIAHTSRRFAHALSPFLRP